jgi:predicted DNA binding CopG/RHH family protein
MKEYKLDPEEKEILSAIERGEWEPVSLNKKQLKKYIQAAKNTLKKDMHVHIRLSRADLNGIKTRAVREGIPYQTLISSILHKYTCGMLVPKSP